MYERLFLVAALLTCCAGEASEDSVSVKILASAGETVILPCHINVRDDVPTVEWSKDDLQNIALLYRHGCETHEMKKPVFWYRTSLIWNEVNDGNVSLRISNVQVSDAGNYTCKTLHKTESKAVTVELAVVAVSEPKLSFVNDGAALLCEAGCWFAEPEITFLDDQENIISAEDPKSGRKPRECFTVTRILSVQTIPTNTNRVICRVHQPEINQIRVTEICVSVWAQKLPVSRQSSDQSATVRSAESYPVTNQADTNGNATAEHLRETDELKQRLHDKDEIIHKLTADLNDLRSKQSPVVCQHGQPTIDDSDYRSSPDVNLPAGQFLRNNNRKPAASTNSNRPKSGHWNKDSKPGISAHPALASHFQKNTHNHSSPALVTNDGPVSPSSSSPSTLKETHAHRTMSFSESRLRSHIARPRRYSTSGLSPNRFSPLVNLPEDMEQLQLLSSENRAEM